MERKAVVMRGPFTTSNIAMLAETLRAIDHQNPTALFEMYMIDPNSAELETKRLFAEILPPLADRQTSGPEVFTFNEIGRLRMIELAARAFLNGQTPATRGLLQAALDSD